MITFTINIITLKFQHSLPYFSYQFQTNLKSPFKPPTSNQFKNKTSFSLSLSKRFFSTQKKLIATSVKRKKNDQKKKKKERFVSLVDFDLSKI